MNEPDRRQAAANNLIAVLTRRPVATIDELKAVLQTDVRMTVYRVLKDIAYQTSYSHGGRYYALKELMEFDQHGLWSARSVWFSKHGTLMATLEQCIRDAERGYFSSELEALLHVGAKESLLRLTQQGRVSRERVSHGYLYCSTDAAMRRRQLAARAAELGRLIEPLVAPAGVSEDVKAAIVLVAALCDERWRRSPPIGPRRRRLDCRPPGPWPRVGKSCSRARCWSTASASRARDGRGSKKNAGNRRRDPSADAARDRWGSDDRLEVDPQDHPKALRQQGIAVGRSTVGRLLTQMDFRRRVNHKKRSTAAPKDRDQQFRVIGRRRNRFARARDPIVSIDCKKKELVGNFTNAGAAWKQHRIETLATDFRSDATGVAVPYGLYDTEANRGLVVVGTGRETPTFVTDCVATWWKTEGRKRYPTSRRLLILADGGGGNRATCHVWHTGLQAKLCDRYGLTVTVSHYPPGASKWNPIEHRLFSRLSTNWQGEPLETFEKVLKFIRTTTTDTGLRVRGMLNARCYPKAVKASADEVESLSLKKHRILPQWNYTLTPRAMSK